MATKLLDQLNRTNAVPIETVNGAAKHHTAKVPAKRGSRSWTPEEDAIILEDINNNTPYKESAARFAGSDRTETSVNARRHTLRTRMQEEVAKEDKPSKKPSKSLVITFRNLPTKQAMMMSEYFLKNGIEYDID
mgnify:CR=1 FL=1